MGAWAWAPGAAKSSARNIIARRVRSFWLGEEVIFCSKVPQTGYAFRVTEVAYEDEADGEKGFPEVDSR